MLIVPFARGMNWKRPPVVTLALVIINLLVFSFWQAGDDERYQAAFNQYFQSSLPKTEIPRYQAFLRQHQRDDDADEIAYMLGHPETRPYIVISMQHDAAFRHAIAYGEIVKPDEGIYGQWQKDRRAFEEKFEAVVSEGHAFKPAFPEISDLFTQMFLHADTMHLVGNMVFLLIVGLAVERIIGSWLYTVAYLSGGFIAEAFFMIGNSDSAIPGLGASGAISAIMGMYAALFGTRKIPFFYSVGFYFDTIRAPAWILLVAWIGVQAYSMVTDSGSHVAYLAHFGGLVGGGIMGYLATHFQVIDPKDLEIEEEKETAPPWQEEYNRAMGLLGRMESGKAVQGFARLHQQYPDEPDILLQFYKSAKYQPESDTYHQASLAMLGESGLSLLPTAQIQQAFEEYLTRPKPRLNREALHRLGVYFLRQGCLDEAWRIATVLIRNDASSEHTASLAVGLARQLRLQKRLDEAGRLLKWVIHHHQDSLMATQARTLLQAPATVENEP